MILKWNNGQKKTLSIRKKSTSHQERGASKPHATTPPKYATGETWFKINFKLDIPNYTIMRKDRLSWKGGGVAILVCNDIKFDIIDTCSTTNIYILKPSLFS